MKSWRDLFPVHPAADVFPLLSEEDLRQLGEDIRENGLKESIVLFRPHDDSDAKKIRILDGRNRLAAMELIGLKIDPEWPRSGYPAVRWIHSCPEAYVISKNIRRRHLTKEQQAELIIKVMETGAAGLAKVAKPVKPRNAEGQLQGQTTKDSLKERVVEEAKKHGISQRTVERAIAKSRGPTKPVASPKPNIGGQSAEAIVRKVVAFIDKNLSDKSRETLSFISERLTAALQERMRDAPRKLSRPEVNGWETVRP